MDVVSVGEVLHAVVLGLPRFRRAVRGVDLSADDVWGILQAVRLTSESGASRAAVEMVTTPGVQVWSIPTLLQASTSASAVSV